MSVEPTSDSSTDFKARGKTSFHDDAESVLDALPERFQEHSKKRESVHNSLILIPSHPYVNSDGEMCTHLLMGEDYRLIEKYGFTPSMVTNTSKGAGVKFWFRHDE